MADTQNTPPVAWRTRPNGDDTDFRWVYLDRQEQAEDFKRQGWIVEALQRLPRQNCPICGSFLPGSDKRVGEFACPKCGTEFVL